MGKHSKAGKRKGNAHIHHKTGEGSHGHHKLHSGAYYKSQHSHPMSLNEPHKHMKTPESVLKKQATQKKIADQRAKDAAAAADKAKKDLVTFEANAKKYEEAYEATEREAIDNRRKAKATGGFYVPAQPKVALVIRIRGTIGVSPKAKKVMQLFRLRQLHNATFVKLNAATMRMLLLIEPYVTYGIPTRATVQKLIYKRGFGKLNKQRIPIANNSVIEEGLGECGIACAADLVNEIVTVGPNFKQANNFLWPFKLTSPRGGFSSKTKLLHYLEGGEAGNRAEEINALVKRML
uniref:Ribosomal protein L30 ferredoxin-like fold domain-containing protein n=1 Tax=Entomoneis paludosa TaxID=265537 RepID=A0A7S3DVI4_9STRA|mmetsp:Transcript_40742/g.84778  ORF Transcript_40742/g.84778 Transcript_40742/m.84778 type:complete len:292 (+) Transcript_40742:45-920(+)